MLNVLMCMHKMSALRRQFAEQGMMAGTTSSYMAGIVFKDDADSQNAGACADEDDDDSGAVAGTPPAPSFTDIKLLPHIHIYNSF